MSKFLDLDGLERYTYHVKNGLNENKNNILTLEEMNGKKNILYVPPTVTKIDDYAGTPITFTTDSNGYITSNPTNDTRYFQYNSCQYYVDLVAGTYILVTEIKTASTSSSSKTVVLSTSNTIITELSMQNTTGVKTKTFTISTDANYGISSKMFSGSCRLMIIPKTIWDAGFTEYQPYSLSNIQLTNILQSPATNSEIETMWNNS